MIGQNQKKIVTDKKSAFRYFLEFTKPYHKLRPREMEALSLIMYYRHEISQSVMDEEMIDTILFSTKTREKMRKDLGNMDKKVFQNLITTLRKKNVLTKTGINPSLAPKIGEKGFNLVYTFMFDEVQ